MFLLPWALAILFVLSDEWVFTYLLRHEYTVHRLKWEIDGQPRGVFWIPEECKLGGWYITYASGHAAQKLRWKWLFTTLDWITSESHNRKLLLAHRLLMTAFVFSVLAPFAIAALLQ